MGDDRYKKEQTANFFFPSECIGIENPNCRQRKNRRHLHQKLIRPNRNWGAVLRDRMTCRIENT